MRKLKVATATAFVMAIAAISACSSSPPSVQDRSEPSQIFVDRALSRDGKDRILDQGPPRFIKTKLRPSPMTARLPSPYLRMIRHERQPYANGIWDVAEFGFDLETLGPAPSALFHMGPSAGKNIAISLGRYSRAPRWLTKTSDAEIAKNHTLLPGDHIFRSAEEGEVDGSPLIVKCRYYCRATLAITPDFAGLLPGTADVGYGPGGAGLEISFAPNLLPRWKEIRLKALCFAGAVISDSDELRTSAPTRQACVAISKAIVVTMQTSKARQAASSR